MKKVALFALLVFTFPTDSSKKSEAITYESLSRDWLVYKQLCYNDSVRTKPLLPYIKTYQHRDPDFTDFMNWLSSGKADSLGPRPSPWSR